ncbi:MAG: DNA double-strand break repair Rad50 ATPase [Methanobacterium sp. PtaU1.Bin097]|jgi:exonuclease SbcC|nr:MAG: DNA double-strand break repair Rad50 ATPase [Methanobacterium sp. PtaU1.Bin097]
MIFKTLQMENIRSYEKEKIDFPSGTSLFEGDVGSGKSTILMAMEFALFGLGNQRGDALLRKGSKKGSVFLSFNVEEKEYQIKRTLVRGNNDSVRQDKAFLSADGRKVQLSPSEIKERILDILNFKEPPNPRAQSVIYRYAVYTPQEEMKFILAQKPDTRLETLRKAFGIEDYKTAADNAKLISNGIKDKINYLSGQVSDLEQKKASLIELNRKLTDNNRVLALSTEKRAELESALSKYREKLVNLKEIEFRLRQVENEIPHLEKQIKDRDDLITRYQDEIQETEIENQEKFRPEMDKLEKIEKPTSISPEELKEKIKLIKEAVQNRKELFTTLKLLKENKAVIKEKLEDWKDKTRDDFIKENQELTQKLRESRDLLSQHQKEVNLILKKIYKLEGQLDDINNKLENLDELGEICPICGSPLDDAHKKDLKEERERESRKLNSEIKVLNEVKKKGEEQIEDDNTLIEQIRNELSNYKSIINKFDELDDVNSRINRVEGNISNIDDMLSLNIQEDNDFGNFDQYIQHLEDLQEKLNKYFEAQKSLESIRYQYNKNIEKIERKKSEIETLTDKIKQLDVNLTKSKEIIKQLPEIDRKLVEVQSLHDSTDEEYRGVNDKVVETQTLVKRLTEDVHQLDKEIKEKETLHNRLEVLKNYHSWLTDYLIPTLSVIEKHVMQNIHLDFDENFKNWFNLLIDDPSKTGKIDEEFTPIIEQDGFQQEINYLSGGEKTSVALAYRLALNNIVQKVSTGMKSNLLIMDEPTDGFSKEQLFKIRDILNELNYPQIIIVSHERELESFADNIFQIEKIDGVSEVSKVN